MSFPPTLLRHQRRLAGVAITLVLHLALLLAWQHTRQAPKPVADPDRIEWVTIAPPRPVKPAPEPKPQARAAAAPALRAAAAPSAPPRPVAAAAEPMAPPAAETPVARSADDILQQARKDLGKIGKELGKEFPGPRIKAPQDSPQMRMARGMEEANELAPPKWYEGPKVKEIIDPGGYGRKRYRVITANGTYCITVESNHAPDGLDSMKNGIKPKLTNCPVHEQPATTQEWEK